MFAYLLLILITITTTTNVVAQFDITTCGSAKGCMFSPPGCDPNNNCYKAFSWKVVGNALVMELAGMSSNGPINYIAVGFSLDQSMGNDAVTDCTFGGAAGPATHLSYNIGRSNARIATYPYSSSELELLNSTASNGRLYCAVSQLIVPQQSNSQLPPLNSTNFFILMAVGTATDQALNMHDTNPTDPGFPYVASSSINLTAPVTGSSSGNGSLFPATSTSTMTTMINGSLLTVNSTSTMTTTTTAKTSSSLHGFGLPHGTMLLCVVSVILSIRE